MAKKVDQSVLDAGLGNAAAATELYICNGEPTDGSTAAINAVKLHVAAVSPNFTALENGTESGSRQYRSLAIQNITLDNVTTNPGPITHVATRQGTTLKVVTTTASTPVNQNDVVDLGEWLHKQLQPA